MPEITESDRESQPGETPPRRLKLVMPHSQGQSQSSPSTSTVAADQHESSGSPSRPSYSPVTPTLSQPTLSLPQPHAEPGPRDVWVREPEAAPVSLDDNSDVIAMRAAISILQMQRQQSLKDIKDLEKMRRTAADDPEAFVNDLNSGKLTLQPRAGVDVDADDKSDDERPDALEDSRFGKFPAPQNVVRAPSIEWSKYHIVGEPLDRMHDDQRRYPGFGEGILDAVQKPQPHMIASPYKAFADKFDHPQTPPQRDDDGS